MNMKNIKIDQRLEEYIRTNGKTITIGNFYEVQG